MKAKPKLNTYVHIYHDVNSHGQEGFTTTTFKAVNLEELDKLIEVHQNAEAKYTAQARFIKQTFKGPKDFYYAGGFAGDDVSFVCKTTGEDLSEWYQEKGWGHFKD